MFGMSLEDLGQYQEAIKTYEKIVALRPDYTRAWYEKGLILELSLEKYDEAIESYEKVVSIMRKKTLKKLCPKSK